MIIANFINKQDALVTGLDQYDYGQVLRIQGLNLPAAVEIHFGLEETGGTTTTRIGVTKDGVTDVPIPDSMLENGDTSLDYTIYAFVYLTDDTSGKTVNRIKIQVKARSKPELLNKPEDKELFQKAIEAVNQSAKEAEGWAHGREDMPERATDNAEYYAGESAKSAEEVKKVEQSVKDMVATVDGIEQQVQDVKEYAGQAKTAAENALLSEQEAKKSEEASLQHRTGAETAENNAELAEQNAKKSEQAVEQAKQLVMQMGQEVLNNKNHVDGKVEAFNKVVTDAVDAVGAAKTDAVNTIGTKGTEQTKKVADEGAKQVKAVEDKGNEVLQSIPEDFTTQMASKLDKQQGSENKGKALVVGDDGNVVVGEVTGGDGIPIINTMSGESPLVVPDSAERVNKGFELIGKSEQLTTTGKNLFDINAIESGADIKIIESGVEVISNEAYPKAKMNNQDFLMNAIKNSKTKKLVINFKECGNAISFIRITANVKKGELISEVYTDTRNVSLPINTTDITEIIDITFEVFWKGSSPVIGQGWVKGIQLEFSDKPTPYEPYTGGKPSPSPEYPQEIRSVGKWNEEKQKYEVDVVVSGKNIVNIDSIKNENGTVDSEPVAKALKPFPIIKGKKYLLITQGIGSSNVQPSAIHFGEDNLIYEIDDRTKRPLSTDINYMAFLNNEERRVVLTAEKTCVITKYMIRGNTTVTGQYSVEKYGLFELEGEKDNFIYQPYKEQTLTITSDRPITKWDKLVEKGGQIGWMYETKKVTNSTNLEWVSSNSPSNLYFATTIADAYGGKSASFCRTYKNINDTAWIEKYANHYGIYGDHSSIITGDKCFRPPNETITTLEQWKQWVNENPLEIVYHTKSQEFIPLPQSEQDAIRALKTYYPTTVITVDGGEVNPDIEVTYIADTKNYIDQKIAAIGKTVVETQKALL